MIEAPPSPALLMRFANPQRFDATRKLVLRAVMVSTLIAACLVAPLSSRAVTVKHQATGTVQSRTPSAIVMLKQFGTHHAQWDFVLTHDTEIPPGVNKGVRVTIYYHDDTNGRRIADRIKVLAVAAAKKAS
jgi:hypothetical protein